MTLIIKLAEQDQMKLETIAASMNANQSDALRILINEKFQSLQEGKSLTERRDGHPKYLLNGTDDSSERANRKSLIAAKLSAKSAK